MIATSACPECGTGLVASDRFCGRCGVGIVRCGHCGGAGLKGDRFCAVCGRDLSQHVTDPTTDGSGQPLTTTRSTASPWESILRRLREATDGEYEVIREIGRGGMAAVFLAHEVALNRRVAIKVMSPGVMLSDGMVDRFHQEAVTVANLTHANIVTVHAVRHVEDLHFFVMEFINGRPLDRVLASRGQLSLAATRAILGQVGSALAYAHRRGVIHRDVKPGNIILDADGQAIVTDFGIAKVLTSPSTTQTGAVHGTAAYMSPEQCYAQPLTPASDQYSLGIVAYEMIAGRTPFVAENAFALMQAHTAASVPSLATLRRSCPPDLDGAVVRMLGKKPTDRWPSMSAALSALQAFPPVTGDPVVDELIDLADAEGARSVGEVLRTPPGPIVPVARRTPPRATPPAPTVPHARDERAPVAVPPRTIRVEPAELAMEVGDSSPARAIVRGGLPMSALENVVWTSSAPHCALVDDHGVITAAGAGTATITAAVGEATSTLVLTVTPARVASLKIQPLDFAPIVGASVHLVATAADKSGRSLTRTIQWSAHPADVGTISNAGKLTLRAPGTITIRATCDTARDELEVTVRARPVARLDLGEVPQTVPTDSTLSLIAIARDDEGGRLDNRVVTWVSSDPTVATVSNSGVVLAHKPGSVTLTAKCETKAASVRLTVAPPPLAAIELTPLDDDLLPSQRTRVRAVVRDVTGAAVNAQLAWRTTNARVAAVSESGQLEALQPGEAVVSAHVGALSASIVVRVAAPVPAPIVPELSIATGTGEEAEGALVAAPPSDAPAVAPEAPTRARRRRVPVWAWGGGAAAALAVGVIFFSDSTAPPPPGPYPKGSGELPITIAPRPTQLVVGDSLRLTAQGGPLGGGRADAMRWRGSKNIHVDSSSGLVVAMAAGPAVVIASNGEVADTATFDVVPLARPPVIHPGPDKPREPVVRRVRIERPENRDTLDVGDVIRLRAVALDSSSRPIAAKATAWSSSDPAVAQVDAQRGAVTAAAPGTVRIVARIDARTDTTTYVVRRPSFRDVAVTGRDSLEVNGEALYSATVHDTRGHMIGNPPVTWSTEPRTIAEIDASGRLEAKEAGTVVVRATVGAVTSTKTVRVTALSKPDPVVPRESVTTPPPPPTIEELFRRGVAAFRSGVDQCARQIGARDVARLQTLYAPATDADRRNLSRLSALMKENDLTLTRHSPDAPRLERPSVAADFTADLQWRNFTGRNVSRSVPFRAIFGLEGTEWRLRSCRIVGSPRLE